MEITWFNVLKSVMSLPGVTVNRDSFLTESLSSVCTREAISKAIQGRPCDVVSDEEINKIADAVIKHHTTEVTMTSAAAGIPGGIGMFVAVPGDVVQYYYHILVLSQKLAYIYGYPDLRNGAGKLSKESLGIITLFVGIMSGVANANKAIQEVVEQIAKGAIKKITDDIIKKGAIYPVIAHVGKSLGMAITKKSATRAMSKIVPIVGAVISGGLTFAGFYPSSKKLQSRFQKDMAVFKAESRDESNDQQSHAPQSPTSPDIEDADVIEIL